MDKLYINSDNTLWIADVTIFRTSAAVTTGTGSFTFMTDSSVVLSTGVMAYSTANTSEAHWFGTLTSTMTASSIVTADNFYLIKVNLSNSTGPNDERYLRTIGAHRGST